METFGISIKEKNLAFLPKSLAPFLLCMGVLAVALPNRVVAQEWRFEPIVKVGGEIDDNATLDTRTDEEVELSGLLLDLKADIKYSSATTSFIVQPRMLSRNYNPDSKSDVDEDEFDSDDFFLQSRFSHKGKSNTIGFRGSFEQENVRTAERAITDLDIDDPIDITDDDTGRIVLTGTRSKWRFTPSWDYRFSDTSSVGATLDYFDVEYEDVFAGLLTNYTDARFNLSYRRTFSNVNSAIYTVTARRYEPEAIFGDDVSGYGLMGGFEHAMSEKTSIRAMIGVEDSQKTGVELDPEVVGNITLIRNLETIKMFAQYRRSVSAGGGGRISTRDSININFRRRLSEKITAGLGVRAYRSDQFIGSLSVDRNYVQLESSFRWYLSTSLIVEASYRYTVDDRGVEFAGSSNSNQINLWFTYQPRTVPKL